MKRLILVRHGKSSWKHDVPDDERPLKKRGVRDGKLIADTFKKFNTEELLIWSSPAKRARKTARIFKKKLDIPDSKFFIIDSLYTFDAKTLQKIISTCEDKWETLMVFGHNPAITNVVNTLGNKEFYNVPTTGLTVIDLETEHWNQLKNGNTILNLFPKNIK